VASRSTSASARGFELGQDDVYGFLARVALGSEQMPGMIPSAEAAILLHCRLLVRCRLPSSLLGKHWSEYPDVIENALDAAERADLSLLPALLLCSQPRRQGRELRT
jgi:hypothetical protein